jgi:hypothetical protein
MIGTQKIYECVKAFAYGGTPEQVRQARLNCTGYSIASANCTNTTKINGD